MKRIKMKILLSALLAVIIAVMVYGYLDSLKSDMQVYVFASDVQEKTLIDPSKLQTVSISGEEAAKLGAGLIHELKEEHILIALKSAAAGDILRKQNLLTGTREELIEKGALAEDGTIQEEYFVEDNKRLFAVAAAGDGALGNGLKAGDRVDIIYTVEEKNSIRSEMILQNIEISSISQPSASDGQDAQVITLIVSPQQAVKLSHAKHSGKLDLALTPLGSKIETVSPVSGN